MACSVSEWQCYRRHHCCFFFLAIKIEPPGLFVPHVKIAYCVRVGMNSPINKLTMFCCFFKSCQQENENECKYTSFLLNTFFSNQPHTGDYRSHDAQPDRPRALLLKPNLEQVMGEVHGSWPGPAVSRRWVIESSMLHNIDISKMSLKTKRFLHERVRKRRFLFLRT